MKRATRTLVQVALAVLVLLTLPQGASTSRAADPPVAAEYKIAVDLDFDAAALVATETVHFRNLTGFALNSLVFNVTPAYYHAFTLRSASVNGQPVQAGIDGVVFEVPLSSPLATGASTTVTLDFGLQVPTPGNLRFGKAGGILALGNWYPVLSVYLPARGDWDRHQYTDTGDAFFTEAANYGVTLAVNRPVSLAYTGSIVSGGGTKWTLSAQGVRDFALALSDTYASQSATVDGVSITAFYLPQHASGGALFLRTASEVVHWADQNLGQYPYPSLFVVETNSYQSDWVGQEYPNVVFISSQQTANSDGMGGYLSYLVAHEVLHQWFYALVGDDQLNEPWLDEANVTYLSYQFFRFNYPGLYPGMWQRFVDSERVGIKDYGDRPVNSSIYDYRDENYYFIIVYRKGALFLDELRQTLGDDAYYAFLRDVVSSYSRRIITGTQFLDLAQSRTSIDLRPLIRRYFTYSKYSGGLDYDLANGHFYTQANGQPLVASPKGFAIVNDADAPMWSEFSRLGGTSGLGYPISRRFKWDGFVVQAMQKGVLQWQPQSGRAYLVNVFDEMSKRGLDSWLTAFRQVPAIVNWSSDAGLAWSAIVKNHQALLDANPAIKARYFAEADPVLLYGLPMSFSDMGNNYTLRAQRVVIQQWKVDVPWAAAGQVTVANGGDIAKENGLLPQDALAPDDPPAN